MNETKAFRPIDGGYTFQPIQATLFHRPQAYRVDQAQKAEKSWQPFSKERGNGTACSPGVSPCSRSWPAFGLVPPAPRLSTASSSVSAFFSSDCSSPQPLRCAWHYVR